MIIESGSRYMIESSFVRIFDIIWFLNISAAKYICTVNKALINF